MITLRLDDDNNINIDLFLLILLKPVEDLSWLDHEPIGILIWFRSEVWIRGLSIHSRFSARTVSTGRPQIEFRAASTTSRPASSRALRTKMGRQSTTEGNRS